MDASPKELLEYPFAFDGLRLSPEFGELRQQAPITRVVLPTGGQAWLVTRHADAHAVLSDARFSRAAAESPWATKLGPFTPSTHSLLGMDPPEHTRIRRLVSRAFQPQRVTALRPLMQTAAETLLKQLRQQDGPVDLLATFALPFATTGVLQLLGIPEADSGPLHVWTPVLFNSRAAGDADPFEELIRYLRGIIEKMRRDGVQDGVIGSLIAARDEQGQLSEDELIHFVLLLITAGHRSTANAIATGMLNLLRRPELFARLHTDRELLPNALEELLRYNVHNALGALPRVAVVDVELGGVTIRARETVLVSLGSANHDEDVFPDAETVDIERDTKMHLAFGHGAHFCIGASFARLETEVALECVLRFLPSTLRLAVPAEQVPIHQLLVGYALAELPVVW